MAMASTYDLPNYVGELFHLTDKETPLLAMAGGLTGGRLADAKQFTWQTKDLPAAAQPSILEGAVPASAHRVRAEVSNVVQIFQYGVDLSYTKLGAVGQLGTPTATATAVLGVQPVQNELSEQLALRIEQAARDVNFTFHQGVFQLPTDNTTALRSRGLLTAITTNVVDAGTAAPLTDALIDSLLLTMWGNQAPFRNPVMFTGSLLHKQEVSGIYGYAPQDRSVGGVNIEVIETDAARLGIVVDRQCLASVLAIYDMSVVVPRFLPVPGKGVFFTEPMAKTKASEEVQLYGQIGLEYGPQTWHGKITDLAT